MGMIRLRVALLLVLAAPLRCVHSAASPSHELLVAPAHLDASLAVHTDPSTSRWSVEASHGGILMVQMMKDDIAVPTVDLTNLSSIQTTWTPLASPVSSTFDRLFSAVSPALPPALFSAGIHVRVTTTPTSKASLSEANALVHRLIQASSEPLRRLLLELTQGNEENLLARSLCISTELTSDRDIDQNACFSASFEHSTTLSLEDLLPLSKPPTGAQPRTVAVSLRPSTNDPSTLTVEVVRASVVSSDKLDNSAVSEYSPRVKIVKSVESRSSTASVLSVRDLVEETQSISPANDIVTSKVGLSILGEGFHRRVRLDLSSLNQHPSTDPLKVMLVVPLSRSVYADLDELRRLERFGELKLFTQTKHIEIERPTAVSSQHMIALEFPIDSTQSTHVLEFPIHLRYQSPSNSTFYSQATLIAPEVFVSCGSRCSAGSVHSQGEPLLSWFSDGEITMWRRVVPASPLGPLSVPVPVGVTLHGPLVSAMTLSVTGLGAVMLVYVAWTAPKRTDASESVWKPKTS